MCIEGTCSESLVQKVQESAVKAAGAANASQSQQLNQNQMKQQESVQIADPDMGNSINLLA